ncbi:MAG: iron-containing alcohol dehydrogenase [bacterium]
MMSSEVLKVVVPQTLFGIGAVNELGDVVRSLGPTKILIVTDQGLVKAGIVDTVQAALGSAGLKADLFDRCGLEAPVSAIEELSRKAKDEGYDLLIGVGGGSVLDTTKAASLLAANPSTTVQDLIEGKPVEKALTKILIPTTAGTGSEWSWTAVVTTDTADDRTYPYFTPKNYPDAVIIDPALTKDLPARTTAETGMDALTHAIEAYTCSRANLLSDMYASTAMKLISTSLRPAYAKGSLRLDDRYRLSIAAAMAMLAGSLAGVGMAHFMNHALGKKAHISHGATVGLMLPYVMEYNLISDPEKFAEVARLLGEKTSGLSTVDAALKSVAAVRRFLSDLDMPQRLAEVGLTAADVPDLVDELMTLQAFPLAFMNPREVGAKEATEIYLKAL